MPQASSFPWRFAAPRTVVRLAIAALMTVSPFMASAQPAYPSKPIRIVAPFPPGNSSDVAARFLSEQLSEKLGQSVVVEKKVGAAGQLGASYVAKSDPDGYTLLMTSTSAAISPAIYKSLPFDIVEDFTPIVQVAVSPMVLLTRADFPQGKLEDFVAEIRKNPKSYSYATAGTGTIQHLTMAAFLSRLGVDVLGVPYKGSPQALTDLIGGQVQFMFDAVLSAKPHFESGRLKPIAVASAAPTPQLPGIPAAAQSAVPELKDFVIEGWVGLLGPKGMPADIARRLNQEIVTIITSPAMQDRLAKANIAVAPANSPQQFGTFLRTDVKRWQDIASAARIPKE
ncbi:Bug family tripartite tricarboxylate transporter substrate binding protein [Pigmentiphaga litoralis]|uniref:Tripartite-type tricarboxylate transporter receptor subunit TctC n=1 Tax=Pigmentiphaga litoralis TaxID=516702 RepID=A0A7Y9IWC5_9BURK|nr:tripartite tricarboxylate transporter substrate binding protein [Pigmentiphaga litoralis]NYE22187.1 tripartite-type tricarboxylate transporter receptor subunit TctC [Pigmentiphaga litoralis]NYE84198.1 tripartite-type tricarboxylate transporter receptor subunit TctC [Pigmentiphaga litoralis]